MNTDMKLEHQSFVVVSDELSHSAITVHGILEKMIPKLKEIDEDVEMIHYWTDGPTSQYRNKQVFSLLLTTRKYSEYKHAGTTSKPGMTRGHVMVSEEPPRGWLMKR